MPTTTQVNPVYAKLYDFFMRELPPEATQHNEGREFFIERIDVFPTKTEHTCGETTLEERYRVRHRTSLRMVGGEIVKSYKVPFYVSDKLFASHLNMWWGHLGPDILKAEGELTPDGRIDFKVVGGKLEEVERVTALALPPRTRDLIVIAHELLSDRDARSLEFYRDGTKRSDCWSCPQITF